MDREYTIEIEQQAFLDAQASLASTPVSPLVRWYYFRTSILSVSLVALREKLKKADPIYFFNFGSR